jgi:anti-sigma B factor antagonist
MGAAHPATTKWKLVCHERIGGFLLKSRKLNADGLEMTLDKNQERTILRLKGHLGLDSSPALRDQLLAILQGQTPKAVVVDLAELSYVDASGIATLLEALKISRNRQSTLCLTGLQGRLLHLFEVTGVLPLFDTDQCRNASSELKVP